MALKKSELYSSLWSSCDELRGGMDASQYKDYVLVLLFIKYVSDKYAGQPFAPITIPEGASFKDMVALKGKPDIGDQINKKIIAPLANANKLSDMPDFNDANKLGSGKEMVERLTNLIAIFENKALDFSRNRAEGDDILGDAYEFLMRHFATESGKSKGQFYTPAEVSRIIAQISGIRGAKTSAATTVYDPTCGSGSLLLKVGDEAGTAVTLYGQEKDAATSGLARMNMILHDNPTALIVQGNTLSDPKFKDGQGDNDSLKTFDYVVANPPFSDKRWSTGLDPLHDPYQRFQPFGTPPAKQGDYGYLLHIVRSLKSTGKGACILPHGVLFRGNAEADIRRNLVRKGYLKGIIGLPANLFYGTGIPACIVVIDKQDAHARKGIFLCDASGGFMKDGPKNRLRAQDIHKIVDVFNKGLEIPKYSRMVPVEEIEKNEFNLNLPRYIDSQTPEDLLAHYQGKPLIDPYDIYQHLMDYWAQIMQDDCYLIAAPIDNGGGWKAETTRVIETDKKGREKDKGWSCDLIPKPLIVARYYAKEQAAIDQLAAELESVTARLAELEEEHGGEEGAFAELDKVNKANVAARLKELEAEAKQTRQEDKKLRHHSRASGNPVGARRAVPLRLDARFHGHDGVAMVAEATAPYGDDSAAEVEALLSWLKLNAEESDLKKRLKDAEVDLDAKAYAHYPKLTDAEIKALVVDDKWLGALDAAIHGEMDRVSQQLTQRVKDLTERYETPLPQMAGRVAELEVKVNRHLERMGFSW